jgi:hypothetical protein
MKKENSKSRQREVQLDIEEQMQRKILFGHKEK